jgi:ABC-type transporter MlaC component
MPSPLENLEARIEALEQAAEGVRSATREAHEATKQLRETKREIEHLLATEAARLVELQIGNAVRLGLEEYSKTITRAQQDAVVKVQSEFDKLMKTYLYGRPSGDGEHIGSIAERRREFGL